MPELPEVETTRRGISPHALGQTIERVNIYQPRLRWPVPPEMAGTLQGQTLVDIRRRGKYLLFDVAPGTALLHLGMSGSLRVVDATTPLKKHDHLELILGNERILRFHDPRRFGSFLWADDWASHPLIAKLGPEPLGERFSAAHLYQRSRGRKAGIKVFVMNSEVVVGVGNIYASEALFKAGIHPKRAAGRISMDRYKRLETAIRETLSAAIKMGGTTLRDFYGGDGEPGYFKQQLAVYEREGEACLRCESTIKRCVLGQRASYYCPKCQR